MIFETNLEMKCFLKKSWCCIEDELNNNKNFRKGADVYDFLFTTQKSLFTGKFAKSLSFLSLLDKLLPDVSTHFSDTFLPKKF